MLIPDIQCVSEKDYLLLRGHFLNLFIMELFMSNNDVPVLEEHCEATMKFTISELLLR